MALMKELPFDPKYLSPWNSKKCKQCRKRRPIHSFISKSGTALCVTCSICRKVQEMRFRRMEENGVMNRREGETQKRIKEDRSTIS